MRSVESVVEIALLDRKTDFRQTPVERMRGRHVNAEIVTIGTELLLGEIVDSNARYIARALRDIGVNLYFKTTVGDNKERIVVALQAALARADVVITTGGLGPTVDDMTRESVADAFGRPLEYRGELIPGVEALFKRLGRTMSENNRRQAYLPAGAVAILNPVGTAPAFIVEGEQGMVISLPGVPREMKYLLDHEVLPYLRQRCEGPGAIIKAVVLHTVGIGESQIDNLIADFERMANPTVGLAAHEGETDIRITAKASDEAAADALIAPVAATIRRRLGRAIYGQDETVLWDVVEGLLRRRERILAIPLTAVAAMTLASWPELQKSRQVEWLSLSSEEAAATTAAAARALAQQAAAAGHWGLALTGVPGGGRFPQPEEAPGVTYLALCSGAQCQEQRLPFNGDDEVSRGWIARAALNLVRLQALEEEGATNEEITS